jgi:NAD(P)-dependent dehydrogenase (short-subunit alcohol dehydrogenase family)
MSKHALIAGASRGLGLGLVDTFLKRGWTVTATQRSPSIGLKALECPALAIETVDIDDDAAVTALQDKLAGQSYDLVFIVAGISNGPGTPMPETSRETSARIFQTNAVSPINFAEAFAPQITHGGTLAFMSSILGSVSLNTRPGHEIYRASKAALNTLARSFTMRHGEAPWDVVLMHPGWVRTDMGGSAADIDVQTSVTGMADVLEQPGRRGCTFVNYKGETLTW